MEQKEFLEIIRACKRRLNLAGLLKKLIPALGIGGAVGIVFQVISLMVPVYYVNVYTAIALLLAVLAAAVIAYIKRSSMEGAALVMDGYGFQERIVTAYENLQKEGEMYALQRRDAMECLRANRDRIQIPLMPPKKNTLITLGVLTVMLGLVWVPSPVREQAKELHEIRQQAKEKEEEIEEVLEELEELEQQELTEEQLAALQEMMESLQASMTEYNQASTGEKLKVAGEKLNYKYENMSEQLGNLAQSLQNGATASPVTAQAMQAMADKLQQMSGNGAGSQMASNQNGQNNSNNGQNGQNNGNSQNNGQNGQNSQNGNGQNSGQNGGQNSGQNGNGQNGAGNGNNGSDGGTGNGSGNGNGTGNGRGTGSVNNDRDYVSVPNAIADSGNLMGNASNHDNSEFFRAPNGMNWEGTHISYQSVIGSYEQNAYEGIATGQYPSGMEDIIKEYFASFN